MLQEGNPSYKKTCTAEHKKSTLGTWHNVEEFEKSRLVKQIQSAVVVRDSCETAAPSIVYTKRT